jgi:hypothetical protein
MPQEFKDLVARLRTNAKLAPLAELLEMAFDDSIDDIPDGLGDFVLDVETLNPLEQDMLTEAVRAITSLTIGGFVELVGNEMPTLDEVGVGVSSSDMADQSVAAALSGCAAIAAEIRGGPDDRQRVIALVNLGFADSLLALDPATCDRQLTGIDRDWAVAEAGRALTTSVTTAARAVMAGLSGMGPEMSFADISALVDAPMVALLRLFPDVVDEFTGTISADLDSFLNEL